MKSLKAMNNKHTNCIDVPLHEQKQDFFFIHSLQLKSQSRTFQGFQQKGLIFVIVLKKLSLNEEDHFILFPVFYFPITLFSESPHCFNFNKCRNDESETL